MSREGAGGGAGFRAGDDRPQPYPDLDLNDLIGLTPDEAVVLAESCGVARIRVIEHTSTGMVGAIDLVLARKRLDLHHQDGRVVFAMFPAARSAGEHP